MIKPYYPAGKRGHPPMGIEKMLRIICSRSGSTCWTQPPRMLFTIAMPCGNSRVSIPRDALNQSDFCDKRLKYKGFYRKNNLKSEFS